MTKVINDPSTMATPRSRTTIPKYIGWRLKLNGPSKTKEVDSSNGLTVVFFFLNIPSAQIFSQNPKITKAIPMYLYGKGIICLIGKRKCKPIPNNR